MVKRSTRLAKRNEYLDVEKKVKEALGSRKDAAAAAADHQAEQDGNVRYRKLTRRQERILTERAPRATQP
jgi:hypothetical protein